VTAPSSRMGHGALGRAFGGPGGEFDQAALAASGVRDDAGGAKFLKFNVVIGHDFLA
jgi:hypothetical protein